eukprot:Nitzschia sp. Nitz4//scaffold40_size135432//56682//58475//NITZ4_003242-RA/size135432-processed-gene-0.18-mRNA-1//1//CDS//3329551213//5692//frame0
MFRVQRTVGMISQTWKSPLHTSWHEASFRTESFFRLSTIQSTTHSLTTLFVRRWQSSSARNDRFVVSILGPPNAGKSTLFNRLQCKTRNKTYRLGSNKRKARGRVSSKQTSSGNAIVSSEAGTTRDRRECWGRIGGTEFTLMDTAGVDGDRIQLLRDTKRNVSGHDVERAMMEQTLEAARESDLVLLMWDAKVGLTADLTTTARWLRKLGKGANVVVLANKLEGDAWAYPGSTIMEHIEEVKRLGLGEPIPISALQGEGMADIAILIEQLKALKFPEKEDDGDSDEDAEKPLQMAVLGRQNVGKSTLVNTLLKSNRVIAGSTPGLTRDAIAVEWEWDGIPIQLVDTAGIRKMTKRMDDSIEDMSVADALRAMKVAEVAVLVLDAEELFLHRQEVAICNAIMEEGRALVIAANKMDLLEMSAEYTPADFAKGVHSQLEERIPILRGTPVVPMSCLSNKGVDKLLPIVLDAKERWCRTIPTSTLNKWLKEVMNLTRPPSVNGLPVKLKYIIQTKGRPPTFIIFANVDELPEAYIRYITRHFQDSFEMHGIPIRIVVKKSAKENPFNRDGKKRSGFGIGGRQGRQKRRVQGYVAARKRKQ